ncbi:hypothetical protein TcasGA2_TC031544 [Tribolium castaneum]|uniref:Uncharacterized protein n=1 Tax=Tribolium castaneum TaxID=7070 RepID=A0A139WP33_TRICA|nr:hypothetical protein TcasGA2_TC031544 [Tribolium castaneum]
MGLIISVFRQTVDCVRHKFGLYPSEETTGLNPESYSDNIYADLISDEPPLPRPRVTFMFPGDEI